MAEPKVVVVLSGKRKSGKDYVASLLQKRLGCQVCSIMRLSAPLKSQYASEHNLDFDRLLDASQYKECHRIDMIRWGEERRLQDPTFFCRLATKIPEADRPVWLISDARRLTDLKYFRSHYPQTIAVRINADGDVRTERGFIFTSGILFYLLKNVLFPRLFAGLYWFVLVSMMQNLSVDWTVLMTGISI